MKIILDVFGGDNAPLAILDGAARAVDEYGARLILTGDEGKIHSCAEENHISLANMEIAHADTVIGMEEPPSLMLNEKKNCSMAVGLNLLRDGGGDAFISAGSTGALVVGATRFVRRMKGVRRAPIASLLPTSDALYLLIDTGANMDCRPEFLAQFGLMGSIYMKNVMGIENPRVGLLNVGTEETKGGELQLAAYELLKAAPINFVGNVEPREAPRGACDVLVADGFSGNIVVKLTEGVGLVMFGMVKNILTENLLSKFAAMLLMPGLKTLKKKMDYSEYGGAPLLGFRKPVFKSHGSSNANAIKHVVRQAMMYVQSGAQREMEAALTGFGANAQEEREEDQ